MKFLVYIIKVAIWKSKCCVWSINNHVSILGGLTCLPAIIRHVLMGLQMDSFQWVQNRQFTNKLHKHGCKMCT